MLVGAPTADLEPRAPGDGEGGCGLGLRLPSRDFGNGASRGCWERPGCASCKPVPAGSSAAGGELPPGVQSAGGPHLAGRARPLEAMASAPLLGSPARGWPVPFGSPNDQRNLLSPPREHARVGAPSAARPSSHEGGGEEGGVQADLRPGAWMHGARQAPSDWTGRRGAEPWPGLAPWQPGPFFWEGCGLGNQISSAEN